MIYSKYCRQEDIGMGILDGKTAIITGASSGVGYGCALRFAEEGANVIACARRLENLERLREEAGRFSGKSYHRSAIYLLKVISTLLWKRLWNYLARYIF